MSADVLSAETKVGIAVEAAGALGTGVAPKILLPVSPPTLTEPSDPIVDAALRGGVFRDWASYEGTRRVEGTLEGNIDVKHFCYILKALLGGTVTQTGIYKGGAVSYYAYKFATNAESRGLTIQVEDGIQTRRYLGCKIASLEIRLAAGEGPATFSISLNGMKMRIPTDTDYGATGSIPADTSEKPLLGWMTKVGIGGTGSITITPGDATTDGSVTETLGTTFAKLVECTLTFEREIATVFAAQNQREPSYIISGPLGITATATIHFDTWDDMNRYRNKNQENFFIQLTYGTENDPTERTLDLRFPKMDFGEAAAEIDLGGVTPALSYSMRALYDPTEGAPIEIVIVHNSDILADLA